MKNLIIAGGTGFLGKILQNNFSGKYNVIVISRSTKSNNNNVLQLNWKDNWQKYINSDTNIINLAGKSINCLFTKKNKRELISSRVNTTKILNEAVSKAKNPPELFIQASGISYYAETYKTEFDEYNYKKGTDFLSLLTQQWENVFYETKTPETRKTVIRLAPVLSKNSTAIKSLIPIVKLGLGGKQGNGKQLFPFIHKTDFIRAIEHIINTKSLKESINLIAPVPATNKEFMTVLRNLLNVKTGIPTPATALHISKYITKIEPEIILSSVYAKPSKLLETSFNFKYPDIQSTLNEIIN